MRLAPLALLAVAWTMSAPFALGAEVKFDFETGDLQGWTVTQGQFEKLVCDRVAFHNQPDVPYNKQGKFFLSTLETAGGSVSDRMTGAIESPVFVLKGAEVSLLVGGGRHADTYVALCGEDGCELCRATGANSEVMQRVRWDLRDCVGQRVFLRIVDENTGNWGHVTFDDFRAEGEMDPKATLARAEARKREQKEKTQRQQLDALRAAGPSLRLAIADLMDSFGERYPDGKKFLARLDALDARVKGAGIVQAEDLTAEMNVLLRDALSANPLVRAQPILFVVREQYAPDHHNTETMFQTDEINTKKFRGGGAIKTIDFARGGEVKTILDAPTGVARDPDVHFDGRKLLFSMRTGPDDDYHIYEIGADGAGLKPLTFGSGLSDIDPLYLPDDRIAFTSTREPKYCMCNRHVMGNLFRMDPDGANVHQIGRNTLFEGHGALTPDGRILYDRWEYVDRNFGDAQGLWTCNPDGTNHALYWGNNTKSPGAVIDARVIPDTHKAIAVFTSCHDRPWGALALLDNRLGFNGKGPVLHMWPASAAALVKDGWGEPGYYFDTFKQVIPKHEDPYPLSDKYFLCSRMTGEGERMGIYVVDVFGNEALLHVEGAGCYDPMPLAPRPRPPVIPDRIKLDRREGTFYVYDVYTGTGMERVARGAVKSLRVVETPEKRFWTPSGWNGQGQEAPAMNWHDFSNKRILGTVPVEADGSAYFTVPADRFVYFQLLDADGMMIQSMRSGAFVRPGETTGCIGCHESRLSAAPNHPVTATRRPPQALALRNGPPREFSYTAEIQPIFDKHCVRCHDFGKPGAKRFVLAGDRTLAFNVSYGELWRKGIIKPIGAGPAEILPPHSWGARESKLVQVIRAGHNSVKLDDEELDRIITWIDLNAPYYPYYASAYPANLFGRSPFDNRQLERLKALTGVEFLKPEPRAYHLAETQVNFTRPELSLCLETFKDKNDPRYREALAILQAGRDALAARPRADMPGFQLLGIEAKRDAKYLERAATESDVRSAILKGEKRYPYKATTTSTLGK